MNKDFRLKVKALEEDGTFEGYASTFGNVDLDGDRVDPDAYNRSIKNFRGEVPILWDHQTDRPVGVTTELQPDSRGLRVKGKLVLATTSGREAYEFLKAKAIRGISIGAQVVRADWDGGVRVLKELRLHEISLVAIPSDPFAEVLAVKRWHCDGCATATHEPEDIEVKALPETAPAATASDPAQDHSLVDLIPALTRTLKATKEFGQL